MLLKTIFYDKHFKAMNRIGIITLADPMFTKDGPKASSCGYSISIKKIYTKEL